MAENQDHLRRLEEQRNSVMAEDERKTALILVRLGIFVCQNIVNNAQINVFFLGPVQAHR